MMLPNTNDQAGDLLNKLANYLKETLGVEVTPKPWEQTRLPRFLKETYQFRVIELLGSTIVLMLYAGEEEQAPMAVSKHMTLIRDKWAGEVIYVSPALKSHNRKRLVERKVPFLVPGNQMYLPTLGIDFREYFRRLHTEPTRLSPSAQVLLISILLREDQEAITPKQAAGELQYSAMTMTRAFNELEAAQLVKIITSGKERRLRLAGSKQETWKGAGPLLTSPVKKKICIKYFKEASLAPRAGLSALSDWTMLAAPDRETHAMSRKNWFSLKNSHKVVEIPEQEPDALEIEVWNYSPNLLAKEDRVDPLSLYLSLREHADIDERIAASLEDLMEIVQW